MIVVYIALGLIAAAGLYVIVTYNALVRLRVRVNEAWSDIEVQMKRLYNLIPNRVLGAIRRYQMRHRETLS